MTFENVKNSLAPSTTDATPKMRSKPTNLIRNDSIQSGATPGMCWSTKTDTEANDLIQLESGHRSVSHSALLMHFQQGTTRNMTGTYDQSCPVRQEVRDPGIQRRQRARACGWRGKCICAPPVFVCRGVWRSPATHPSRRQRPSAS